MSNCYDAAADETVHKGHTGTGQIGEAHEGSAIVTYEVYRCQCGGHTLDIVKSTRQK